MNRSIDINAQVFNELQYLVQLHQRCGAANPMDNVEELVNFVLASVADGSRRPGAWERQLLEMMGLVAHGDEHQLYRRHYGKPEPE